MKFFLLLSLTVLLIEAAIEPAPVKSSWYKKLGRDIFDETVFTNPTSFDYDFSEDIVQKPDENDLYDQLISKLPEFDKYKSGQRLGTTEVPIVTRKWELWFTPAHMPAQEQFAGFPQMPHVFTMAPTTPSTTTTESTTTITETSEPPETTSTEAPTTAETTTEEPSTTTEVVTVPVETTTIESTTQSTEAPETVPQSTSTFRRVVFHRTRPTFESVETTTAESTTTSSAATVTMSRRMFTRRPFFNRFTARTRSEAPRQPPPAFSQAPRRPNFGPVWRKGGQIIFDDLPIRIPGIRVRRPPQPQGQGFEATTPFTQTTRSPFWNRIRRPNRPVNSPHSPMLPSNNGRIPASPKPVRIHHGVFRGPTYNCKVLNPFVDGKPSGEHDSSCKMLYPGLSLDGQCRCFYMVDGRDEHGCAIGFLYACKPLRNTSVRV